MPRKKKDGRGGARAGAGRKPSGRIRGELKMLPEAWLRAQALADSAGISRSEAIERRVMS